MQKPTEILTSEHKNILKVIDTILAKCGELESGAEIDKDFFTKAIDFIKNYADRFHHAKEDNILYPMADEALSEDVQIKMAEEFAKVEEQLEFNEKDWE